MARERDALQEGTALVGQPVAIRVHIDADLLRRPDEDFAAPEGEACGVAQPVAADIGKDPGGILQPIPVGVLETVDFADVVGREHRAVRGELDRGGIPDGHALPDGQLHGGIATEDLDAEVAMPLDGAEVRAHGFRGLRLLAAVQKEDDGQHHIQPTSPAGSVDRLHRGCFAAWRTNGRCSASAGGFQVLPWNTRHLVCSRHPAVTGSAGARSPVSVRRGQRHPRVALRSPLTARRLSPGPNNAAVKLTGARLSPRVCHRLRAGNTRPPARPTARTRKTRAAPSTLHCTSSPRDRQIGPKRAPGRPCGSKAVQQRNLQATEAKLGSDLDTERNGHAAGRHDVCITGRLDFGAGPQTMPPPAGQPADCPLRLSGGQKTWRIPRAQRPA